MFQYVKSRLRSADRGNVAIEYALLLSALAMVIVAVVNALGVSLGDLFNEVFNHLS